MQNEINFDDFVKYMLHNHKSLVPNDLWDKIVAEKETKKPIVYWWTDKRWYMVAAACLILICGTCLFISNKKNLEDVATKSQVPSKQPNNNPYQPSKTETIDNNTTLNQNNNNDNSTKAVANDNRIEKEKKSTNNNANKDGSVAIFKTKHNKKRVLNTTDSQFANTKKQPQELSLTQNDVVAEHKSNNLVSKFAQANTVSLSKLFNYNTKDITLLKLKNRSKIFGLDCPNYKPATWYLEAYGSVDYTMKNVFANGVSDNYLQRIDSTTKMNGGFTLGLRVSKTINDNFLIKSGLQYTQRNEQFSSKSDSIITTTSVVTVRTIVRGGGLSDTTVRDTATVQQIGYRKRITNNHYKSLEIPLLLSYENGNDNWHYAINGGIIANLTSWYHGETLDTSFQLVPLSAKNNNGFYNSNLNLSLYAGVSIIRNIGQRFAVFAEPYFRYGISNTNTSVAGYSQRFNAAGLTLGVRLKLNSNGIGN
ncbi:MAG: hypothetical protein QM541_13060 [Flavobacterium sp.]|nr:hypothetical protein [Flavobacterium sp.]